ADKSFLGSVWDTISSPLIDAPSRWARDFSNWITTPKLDESRPWAMTKGFIGGATEGVGDVISSLTSPIDLTAAVLSGGSTLAAKVGLTGIAQALRSVLRLASAPVAVHGASQIVAPNTSWAEKGFGLAELAGGAAGMRGPGTVGKGKTSAAKVTVKGAD